MDGYNFNQGAPLPVDESADDEEYVEDEELDTEDIAVSAYNRIDALIELLVKKGIITEEEIDDMEDQLLEEEDDEEEEAPAANNSFGQPSHPTPYPSPQPSHQPDFGQKQQNFGSSDYNY
ncbi:MAG: hypothetical protein Q8Q35_00545 [Nanoarchaeota archaeon]|nr:hypothetical protein [Nanoarchaeota archaeon]